MPYRYCVKLHSVGLKRAKVVLLELAHALHDATFKDIAAAAVDKGEIDDSDLSRVDEATEFVRFEISGTDEYAEIHRLQGIGRFESNLFEIDDQDGGNNSIRRPSAFNAGLDSVLSFLLGLYCAGVDIDTPEYHKVFAEAMDRLANDYEGYIEGV